jgi:hypothetical protein
MAKIRVCLQYPIDYYGSPISLPRCVAWRWVAHQRPVQQVRLFGETSAEEPITDISTGNARHNCSDSATV